jgi:hypothetical protein
MHAAEEGEAAWEHGRAAAAAPKRAARAAPHRVQWDAGLARWRRAMGVVTRVAAELGAPTAQPPSREPMKPKQPRGPRTHQGKQARAVRTMSADGAGAPGVRFAVKQSTQTMTGRSLASVRGPSSSPLLSTV